MLLAHVVVSTYVMLLACVIPLACLIVMAPTRCHLELLCNLAGANSLPLVVRFLWPPLTFTAAKLLPDPVAIFTPLPMLIASTSTSPVWRRHLIEGQDVIILQGRTSAGSCNLVKRSTISFLINSQLELCKKRQFHEKYGGHHYFLR